MVSIVRLLAYINVLLTMIKVTDQSQKLSPLDYKNILYIKKQKDKIILFTDIIYLKDLDLNIGVGAREMSSDFFFMTQ